MPCPCDIVTPSHHAERDGHKIPRHTAAFHFAFSLWEIRGLGEIWVSPWRSRFGYLAERERGLDPHNFFSDVFVSGPAARG